MSFKPAFGRTYYFPHTVEIVVTKAYTCYKQYPYFYICQEQTVPYNHILLTPDGQLCSINHENFILHGYPCM